jgi:glucose uptake protein
VVLAIVVDAFAYGRFVQTRQEAASAGADPRAKRKAHGPGAGRGIILSVVSGILMGMFYPLVEIGKQGDNGVAPYGIALLFGAGVFLSSLVYIPFFMTFPVSGEPLELRRYFQGTGRQHLLGLAGGVIWMAGAITNFVAASSPVSVQVGPAVSYALGQGATLVSALWGLLVWKEFAGANQRVKLLLMTMLVLFVSGLAMVSIAPLNARR